jgi:hypothetical protein
MEKEVRKILYSLLKHEWEARDNKHTVDDVVSWYTKQILRVVGVPSEMDLQKDHVLGEVQDDLKVQFHE